MAKRCHFKRFDVLAKGAIIPFPTLENQIMRIFKFGGASVKDGASVKNVSQIIRDHREDKMLIVVSAMGKMTNAFEDLIRSYWLSGNLEQSKLDAIYNFHHQILSDLFPSDHSSFKDFEQYFEALKKAVVSEKGDSYASYYDQIVSFGELFSTRIVHHYLDADGLTNTWLDARKLIITNSNFQNADVDWESTEQRVKELIGEKGIYLTQGFIAGNLEGKTTTLGREGSDYSAAIFAYVSDAKRMTIWKDVDGFYSADPNQFDHVKKFEKLSFHEAIELAYYGATVVHPKTIQPLRKKEIPLWVKSFINPEKSGTVISSDEVIVPEVPAFIVKKNQFLISISTRDFSFIVEKNLGKIFGICADIGVKVNLMQNTAVSCSLVLNNDEVKIPQLKEALQQEYDIKYNEGLALYTIRHYTEDIIEKIKGDHTMVIEERNQRTVQLLLK